MRDSGKVLAVQGFARINIAGIKKIKKASNTDVLLAKVIFILLMLQITFLPPEPPPVASLTRATAKVHLADHSLTGINRTILHL